MKGFIQKLLQLSSLGLLAAASSSGFAAGYKMEFQSASVLADSGEAAVVEDAGTNWFNSAGLVYVPHQVVGSLIDLMTRTTFTGSLNAPNALFAGSFNANGSAHSFHSTLLPALHYALPFKDRFAVGLSIVPAWGLAEDYGRSSFVRYQLTRVYTKSIDVAPSIAIKINKQWSVGVGPDFNYLSLQSRFDGNLAYPLVNDAVSRISADDWNTGWHAGLLYRLSEATRFGLNYRSKIVMHLTGTSGLFGVGFATPETNAFTFNWVLPPITTLSAYHDLSPCWALMGTISYDQWSTLRSYSIQNYMSATGPTPVSLPQGFRNTFDLGIGAHYRLNEKWLLRGNLKYEPTPTGDLHRDINFPDADKLGVQIGGRYQFTKCLAVDFLYGHVFTKSVPIRPQMAVYPGTTTPITGVTINGHSTTSIDLIGAQLVWNI
ncbi:MAG TPA: outer membrane protein transport protein [Gammaproteobacteria bacterium]|nr:outer membrane protein transport protein [Gammaproteobacteria bacterium]